PLRAGIEGEDRDAGAGAREQSHRPRINAHLGGTQKPRSGSAGGGRQGRDALPWIANPATTPACRASWLRASTRPGSARRSAAPARDAASPTPTAQQVGVVGGVL